MTLHAVRKKKQEGSACSDIKDSGLPSRPGGNRVLSGLDPGSVNGSGGLVALLPPGIAFPTGIAHAVPATRLRRCVWKVWVV